ncbi:MAG: alpha/beta-hydrolase family protein [Pseudomonadota bacterium]
MAKDSSADTAHPKPQKRFIHALGLVLAAVFFAASLTPSLMPRDPFLQGVLAGAVAAIGYEIGTIIRWLWHFMDLPRPPQTWRYGPRIAAAGIALLIVIGALWMAAGWQNATRAAVGLDPVETAYPVQIASIALVVFAAIWILLRLFGLVLGRIARLLDTVLPRRISQVIGFGLALWLFWAVIDGVALRGAFQAADASFEAADILIEPNIPQPQDDSKTGSPASLVNWREMGRWGRSFVATAPTREDIAAFHDGPVMEPVRVYVGRRSAETSQARAELALQELIRVGGFDRSALVIVVPVGTGWMDPGAHDTLDFILGGDVATVAVQYSYLTSVLSLMAHPEYGVQQARDLFNVVYAHWTRLPQENRPKLYVHGLSQGAFNSQMTMPLLDVLADPIDGALWAGSPFFSPFWSGVRDGRQVDSPAWRPRYGNGSLVRTMNQEGGVELTETPWGPIRLVFLNYGSDPIVVFTPDTAFRRPDWMTAPRAFDVSPEFQWFPVVTMFQLALDMAVSLKVERHGHYYVAPDYIDGWAAVVDPDGWSDARADALKAIFAARGPSF